METNTFVEQVMEKIEEYNIGIFGFDPSTMRAADAQVFMVDLKALSEEDCSSLALKLTAHIYSVQFRINKIHAVINYLKDILRHAVAEDILQYKGVSWEYSEVLAIKNNEWAQELAGKIREYNLIKDSTNNQLTILTDLAKRIDNIRYGKKF